MTKQRTSNPFIMSIIMLLIYILNTTVISELIMLIINSPKISNSHIISILFYVQILIPMIAVFVGYAFIVQRVIRTSVKQALPYMIHYQLVTLISLLFSTFWSYISSGVLPKSEELIYSMITLLLNLLLSCTLMYAVVFFTNLIRKKAKIELPRSLTPHGNAFLLASLAAAAMEGIKQLIIELSYIISSIIDFGADISFAEIVSMLISIIFCMFVFAIGYLVMVYVISILEHNKKIQ